MSSYAKYILLCLVITSALYSLAQTSASRASANSFTIVFKDGHQKTYSTAEVSRLEFKNAGTVVLGHGSHEEHVSLADISRIDFNPATAFQPGRNHFVGKWKVGTGTGDDFFITLDRDGHAKKSIGSTHGTWEVVNGEARISWDDGWHDAIRPVGTKHEKVAYEPGKSFDDTPGNVTNATRVDAQPI